MAQVPGHLPLDYWKRTGTSEKHFPNEIYQFDIEGIRRFVFFISCICCNVFIFIFIFPHRHIPVCYRRFPQVGDVTQYVWVGT